jgi:hypothetical protein
MPVIPGTQEGQVLNAGSPVPIASPEESRLLGNATARFGQEAFALGDALDKVVAQQKAKRDVLTETLSLQEARRVILEEQAARDQAAPIADDTTGIKQVQTFHDNLKPKFDEILSRVQDPETRRRAQAAILDAANDTAKEVYGKEVVKRVKNNEVLESQVVSNAGALARANPKDIESSLGLVEIMINKTSDLPEDIKRVRVAEARKQVFQDAIQGSLSRQKYGEAEIILEKYSPGILSPKEKAAQLDEIRNTEYQDANREYTKLNRDEKRQEKYRADIEKNLLAQYSAQLGLAGNSDNKRAPVIAQIELDTLAGKISVSKKDALIGSKVFKQVQDDFYDAKIMKDVFKTDAYGEAIDKVYKDLGDSVSAERGSDIINRLKGLEERKRNDPQFQQSLKDGERLIRDMGADSITSTMDSLSKRELLTKINTAVQDYHVAVTRNPKLDPTNLSRSIIADRFGARVNFQRGKENLMSFTSPEGAEGEKQRVLKEALALKQKGLMTKDLEKKYKNNLRVIEQEKKRLEIQNPTRGEAPTGGGAAGAARGKQ